MYLTVTTQRPDHQWIIEATNRIPEYAAFYRSVYMRWAITINALHVAKDRYASLAKDVGLTIGHFEFENGIPVMHPLEIWPAPKAAQNYALSIPLMAAYGLQDLYGAMEEIIFDLYESYLSYNPLDILEGPEFASIRRLYRARDQSNEAMDSWTSAWSERLESWRRKRIYDGLHRVFASYWQRTQLKRPSWYKETDVADWSKTIEIIGEIRNLITHGENHVSQKLADLTASQPQLGMFYKAADVLEVQLQDLMIVERFFADIIHTLNESLVERAFGPIGGKPVG